MTNHTADSLIAFSRRVETAYLDKQIRSPVHFCSNSQAQPLIDIFKEIRPHDYVCSNWRSMFHALLKGIPEDELFQQYLDGRSMYVMSKEHRFLSSSIVGGMLPTALGLAMGIRQWRIEWAYEETDPIVWVFVGDMTKETGLFHEFHKYRNRHALPIQVVVEDNKLSTNADTRETWGSLRSLQFYTRTYNYERTTPHVGLTTRVQF